MMDNYLFLLVITSVKLYEARLLRSSEAYLLIKMENTKAAAEWAILIAPK